jgi:uncharacterized protein (TIGR00251 family)
MLSLQFESHPDGVILSVRAHAGARRNALKGIHAGALQVMVTQAPEKGKANKAIIELLAGKLDLRRNQLELLAGETSPHKKFLVLGIAAEELERRITDQLGAS